MFTRREESSGQIVVLFMAMTDQEGLPEVSLARVPDHCYYPIDKLQEHNHHAPGFDSEEAANEYEQRVLTDIEKALEGYQWKDGNGKVKKAYVFGLKQLGEGEK